MRSPFHKPSRLIITGTVFAAVAAAALPAAAAISPAPSVPGPSAVTPTAATVSAVNGSTWQTDNAVWALKYWSGNGGIVFAGGDFTHVRAPGAAMSDTSHPAGHIAAFKASDGAPDTTFKHNTDGKVQSFAVSPDGKTLYMGGLFSYVDGKKHGRIAAFDLTKPGYPLLPWNANISGGAVRAIAVTADNSKVVIGGDFKKIAGASHARLAELNAADGTRITSWTPSVDPAATTGAVNALLLTPDGTNVIVGGNFEYLNGQHLRALGSVNVQTGANGPLDQLIPTRNCGNKCGTRSDVKALATDGTNIYVGDEGSGGGWFDGTLAFNPVTGHQVWFDNCLGATQAIEVVGGALYIGSHSHDCSAIGGFGQASYTTGTKSGGIPGPPSWHHLIAEQISDGKLLDWFPTTNAGPGLQPSELGPRAMTTDGTNLWVGGQFSQINGKAQQGVTRFMNAGTRAAPKAIPQYAAQLLSGNRAAVTWVATSDPDSPTLTYEVYRDRETTPFATVGPVTAHWWNAARYEVYDPNTNGTSHSYLVKAVDAEGNSTSTPKFAGNVLSPGYQSTLTSLKPSLYWRLDETSGSTANDTSGKNYRGTFDGSLNLNTPGAFPNETGITLGSTGRIVPNASAQQAPNTFAIAFWFRSTSTRGGRIVGFTNNASGTGSSYDRMVYMMNSGQLVFGLYNGHPDYLWSQNAYNDGNWHFVVAELDPTNGQRLYVDGVRIGQRTGIKTGQSYSGYWKVGADNLNGWPNDTQAGWPSTPSDKALAADLDEVSVHSAPLSLGNIRKLMSAE